MLLWLVLLYAVALSITGADPACRLSITEYVGHALLLEPRPPRD